MQPVNKNTLGASDPDTMAVGMVGIKSDAGARMWIKRRFAISITKLQKANGGKRPPDISLWLEENNSSIEQVLNRKANLASIGDDWEMRWLSYRSIKFIGHEMSEAFEFERKRLQIRSDAERRARLEKQTQESQQATLGDRKLKANKKTIRGRILPVGLMVITDSSFSIRISAAVVVDSLKRNVIVEVRCNKISENNVDSKIEWAKTERLRPIALINQKRWDDGSRRRHLTPASLEWIKKWEKQQQELDEL